MTTLITHTNSDGTTGRCDAKCYAAQGPHCNCCCGGMNHRAGLQAAIDNTRELCIGKLEYMRAQGFELHPSLAALIDPRTPQLF